MRRPAAERRLVIRALWRVALVRLLLVVRPFSHVRERAATLARERPSRTYTPDARTVGWSVRSAARLVPGASCLTQALAAHIILEQCGHRSTLHVGVSRERGTFEAHAWVESGGAIIVGELERDDFVPLPEFATTPAGPIDKR